MTTSDCPSYAGYRFPGEIISYAVWLYFRFPLSLCHVDELLAARGIDVSHETVRPKATVDRFSATLSNTSRTGRFKRVMRPANSRAMDLEHADDLGCWPSRDGAVGLVGSQVEQAARAHTAVAPPRVVRHGVEADTLDRHPRPDCGTGLLGHVAQA